MIVRAIDSRNIYDIKRYTVQIKRSRPEGGFVAPVFKQTSYLFDHNLMNFIVTKMKPGDEFHVKDMVAKDSSGIEAIAPDIKLVIQKEKVKAPKFLAQNHMAAPNGIVADKLSELFSIRSSAVSLEELKNSNRLFIWDNELERQLYEVNQFDLTIKRGLGMSNVHFHSDSAEFSAKLKSFLKLHLQNGDELRFSNINVTVDSAQYVVPGVRLIVDAPFYADKESRKFISVTGRLVQSNEDRAGLSNVEITILVEDKDYEYKAKTDGQGNFKIDDILEGTEYSFVVESTEDVPEGTEVMLLNERGFAVKNLRSGERTVVSNEDLDVLNQIYALNELNLDSMLAHKEDKMNFSLHLNFSSTDEDLLRSSKEEVVKIIHFMKMNPDYRAHFVVYTDSKGNDMVNILVSEQRAYKITNLMLKHGIPYHRISYEGAGEANILNHCKNDVNCTEKEHAVNRRIEFTLSNS